MVNDEPDMISDVGTGSFTILPLESEMQFKLLAIAIYIWSGGIWAGTSVWTLRSSPTSEVFNGISAPNPDFAIGVGKNGTIVHFSGDDNGTLVPSGTSNELFDVFASSATLAVATGAEIVLLWDGTAWAPIRTGFAGNNFTGPLSHPRRMPLFLA